MLIFDPEKDVINIKKHGISLDRAIDLAWETAHMSRDARFDYGEDRYRAIGYIDGRLHVAVFTVRGKKTRMISLRKANVREVKFYAQEKENGSR